VTFADRIEQVLLQRGLESGPPSDTPGCIGIPSRIRRASGTSRPESCTGSKRGTACWSGGNPTGAGLWEER